VVTKYSPEVRAEHRQHLIDAAWRCVARTGSCDMTVDNVCREGRGARMQMRADLVAEMLCEKEVRQRHLVHMRRRHGLLRRAIEEGMTTGDYHEAVPARAVATILLALADGLMLHAAVDPRSRRWPTLRQGVDVLLAGLRTWGISPVAEDTA
jgi:BetI-type transcriptional repressor, C-terminal